MHQKEKLIKTIETNCAIVGLRDDGIVHVYYKSHIKLDVELQLEMIEIFNEITGKVMHPFIFEAGDFCYVTKEARDNAVVIEDLTPISCSVVYANTLAYKIIADFYMRINKPKNPYKVVNKFEKGVEWLLTHCSSLKKNMN